MTEDTGNEQAPECGRLLRRMRERLGLSEDDVASELRLSPFQIRALEEDDWERLPGTTYARGYLRSYARLLDLDVDKLLEGATTQELEIPPARQSPAETEATPGAAAGGGPARRPGRGAVWAWIAGIAAVAVLAGYLWQADRATDLLGGGIGVPAGDGGEAAPPGGGQPDSEAVSGSGGQAGTARSAAAAGGDVDEASAAAPLPDGWARVALRFAERSWVEVRDARGERLLYRSFQPGRQIEVEGEPPFRVYLGNARGVRIEYSGRTITPDTEPGRLFARLVLDSPAG